MKMRYLYSVILVLTAVFITGCSYTPPKLGDHPECLHPNEKNEDCIQFYIKNKETCEQTYGEDAPDFCPLYYSYTPEECFDKLSLDNQYKYCQNYMVSSPEMCKLYFPDTYEKQCPSFFLKSKSQCLDVLGECGAFREGACHGYFTQSASECMDIFNRCKSDHPLYTCRDVKILNQQDCVEVYGDKAPLHCPKFFTRTKDECLDAYKKIELAAEYCPQFFMETKDICEYAFGVFDAPDYCPQFYTKTKAECISAYGEDEAKNYKCPRFFMQTKEDCEQNFGKAAPMKCPQFFQ